MGPLRSFTRSTRLVVPMLVLAAAATLQVSTQAAGAASSCPSGGVVVPTSWTAADWQSAIDSGKTGAVWCVADGVHRILSPLKFRDDSKVIGIDDSGVPGVPTISGGQELTGWTKGSGGVWSVVVKGMKNPSSDPGFPPAAKAVPCLDKTQHCWYPDDVFFGETHPNRKWSMTDLQSATKPAYFENYGSHTVFVNNVTPSQIEIDRAVPMPLGAPGGSQGVINGSHNITIRDLTVEKVGSGMGAGAIVGINYTMDDIDVHLAHSKGVVLTSDKQVAGAGVLENSVIHDNGQSGIGANGLNEKIVGNDVYGNGWLSCDGDCGGMKLAASTGGIIGDKGEGNTFHDNNGVGIWVDISSINYSVRFNKSYDNSGSGIEVEISYDGLVSYNDVYGNGFPPWQKGQAPAIFLNSSGSCSKACPSTIPNKGVNVLSNSVGFETVSGKRVSSPNTAGIQVRQADRGTGTYGTHTAKDVFVRGNTVWECPAPSPTKPPWSGVQSQDLSVFDAGRHIKFDNNAYKVPSSVADPFRWVGKNKQGVRKNIFVTWKFWHTQANQDPNGTFSTNVTC